MKYSRRVVLCSVSLIIALMFSVFGPVTVFAYDENPPVEPTEKVIIDDTTNKAPDLQKTDETVPPEITDSSESGEEENSTPEATDSSTEDPEIQETPEPTGEPPVEETPQATLEETVVTDEIPTVEPTGESAPMLNPEELDTLPEILGAVPDNTEIIVLNDEGQPELMASEDAAETLVKGDPMWCPDGVPPVANTAGCTDAYATFAELLSFMATDASSGTPAYTGNGVIYVADSYNGNDISQININGDVLTNISSSNLTIQGGWNDGSGTAVTPGFSEIDVSFSINNWLGNITVNNLMISNSADSNGFGLFVETQGNTVLENIQADDSTNGNSGIIIYESNDVTINNSSANHNDGNGIWINNSGNVTIENTSFNENGFNGLAINSAGTVTLDNINAWNNDLNGVKINAAGEVQVGSVGMYSYIEGNGSTGLDIRSGAGISLTYIYADMNYTGMVLYTTAGDGDITLSSVYATNNTGTGIHVESGGSFSADSVGASSIWGNGLYAKSQGNITISNSQFSSNINGSGANLFAEGEHIIVLGSHFDNNKIGLQTNINDGLTFIREVTANYNTNKGAYLNGTGKSPIIIYNSEFNENSNYGIYATTEQGNLLSEIKSSLVGKTSPIPEEDLPSDIGPDSLIGIAVLVTDVIGNGTGAKLINKGNGLTGVGGSSFNQNDNAGLSIIANSDVLIGGNFFTENGGNGVDVFSTYTAKSCYCPGSIKTSIIVELTGGDYIDNGGWGAMVKPGPQGDLLIDETTPPIFSGNVLGDYLLDTSDIPMCSNCDCIEKPDGKPYKVVDVPFNGGEQIPQECSIYAGTILQLPDGTKARISCPFNGFSSLEGVNEDDLPGPLDDSATFDLGMMLGLSGNDGSLVINADGSVTISFKIPENAISGNYDILYWDPTRNDGEGGWFQLPPYEEGMSFPIGDDGRMIFSGVQASGGYVSATVNFSGYFILISN